jgi:hypothetical protein
MRLLSMESLAEQYCLAKMLKGMLESLIFVFGSSQRNEFAGNGNEAIGDVHWTSASDEFNEGTFSWCANSSSPLNLTSNLKFDAGEPSNSTADEDCLGAKITTDAVPNNFLLSDYACSKPAKFICEVSKRNEQQNIVFKILWTDLCQSLPNANLPKCSICDGGTQNGRIQKMEKF